MRAPAQQRALAFLTRAVARMRRSGASRLPAYATLATQAGVAPMTMLKALRAFRDRGIIALSHGSGATLLPEAPGDEPARGPARQQATTLWRRVRQAVYRDIIGGRYARHTQLPPHKTLRRRYGASYVTVRHALEQLCRDGFLERIGRHYRVAEHRAARTGNTVVLIAFGGEQRGSALPSYQSPRSVQHLQSIQHACVRAGLHLELVTPHYSAGRLRGVQAVRELAHRDTVLRRSILGFVVWDITIPRETVGEILRTIMQSERPVSLLNETGRQVVPPTVSRSPLFKQFTMAASIHAGREVGDFLLRKGHRRLAYIDASVPDKLSELRLEGLRDATRAAGIDDGVVAVYPGARTPVAPLRGDMGRLFRLGDRIMRDTVRERRSDPEMMRTRIETETVLAIDNAAIRRRNRERLFAALQHRALSCGASAWVAYNDLTAADCLDFLESHGVAVPRDIAVAGFDDSLTAIYHQLTSYNFGGDACMHAMIEHIVNPTATARLAQPVELDGYVMERRTT